MKKTLIISLIFVISCSVAFAQYGVKKKMPRAHEFGNVIINNFSEKSGIAPVAFKHWLHRGKYTCRLCHIDLGFAMKTGDTGIKEDDNRKGQYCGACHNGIEAFAVGTNTPGSLTKNCDRCHSIGKNVKFEKDFYTLFKDYPKARFGNKVDWLVAEEKELIKLKDYLEGYSIKRKPMATPKDVDLKSKEYGIPDIIFSHKKHTIWNGCELCHPEIFSPKKGSTKTSMNDIFEGKHCGACHGTVAFPVNDCQLCHTKEVQ